MYRVETMTKNNEIKNLLGKDSVKLRELINVEFVRKDDGIHVIEDWKLNTTVLRFLRSEMKKK